MKKLLLLILSFGLLKVAAGQDAHFSQYYASSLYLNPASAGAQPFLTFSSNYRTQWRSIVIPYVTSQISLIHPIYSNANGDERHVGGIGLSFYNDRAGDGNFKTIGLNINGAYNLHFNKRGTNFISFGVQGGMIQKNIDYTNLEWGEQFNPYIGFDATINPNVGVNSGTIFADIGAGFIWFINSTNKYQTDEDNPRGKVGAFFGVSAYHLNQPNESFYKNVFSKLPILYKGHAGLEFHLSDKVDLAPNVLVMMQNDRRLINGGMYLSYLFSQSAQVLAPSEVIFGTWYRLNDSFIFSMGMGNQNYTLGFSYDMNSSSLRYATQGRGAYEVSLTVHRVKEKKIKRYYSPRI